MFVIPTARTIGAGNLALGFNESKHTEFILNAQFVDRQVRGVLTYGLTDNLEVSASYYRNLLKIGSGLPDQDNRDFTPVDIKWLITREDQHSWRPAIALAVRDIANDTADLNMLDDVHNGRKFFLLFSKRLLRNEQVGRFLDAHAGITYNDNGVSGLVGFEMTLTSNASLIMEAMWDSPYLDFKNYGSNDQTGRFIFNPGVRIYPELIPGLALDLGFVGDSEFEFSFGVSYVIGM